MSIWGSLIQTPLWRPPDASFNEVGYGEHPFRPESVPSHLPTAEEVEGRHELWLEAVTKPKA